MAFVSSLAVLALVAGLTTAVAASAAGGTKVCVPKTEGAAIVTSKHGKCRKGYRLTTLGQEGKEGSAGTEGRSGAEGKPGPEGRAGTSGLTSSEQETLRNILPYLKYVASGVGGKPTIQFSGVNVQIIRGFGVPVNGEGNLVLGSDYNTGKERGKVGLQTGSENLVLGGEQEFTEAGGIVAGDNNTITGPGASVLGGEVNTASGYASTVLGGEKNHAEGSFSSIFGGKELKAAGFYEAIP
jgi:hypothetical protein